MKIKLKKDWRKEAVKLQARFKTRTEYYGMNESYLKAIEEKGAIEAIPFDGRQRAEVMEDVMSYQTTERIGTWLPHFFIPADWCEVVSE